MSLIRSYEIPYETATKKSKLDEIQKYSFKISPLSLGPDKASNIFGEYKDQTSMIDDILYNISKVSNVTIYHVIHHKTTLVRKIIGSKIQVIKASKTKKITLLENDVIYLEFSEGHYGAYKYKNDTLLFFESMFRKEGDVISSPYYATFSKIIRSRFDVKYIVCDFPNAINNFSLQLTGGSFYIENDFIPRNSGMWGVYQYIYGPDNQNHFCYIWALLYIMCDTFGTIIDFIVNHDIVPAFFIKTFIYYVILKFDDNDLKVENYDFYPVKGYFKTFIKTITSNSSSYQKVYDTKEKQFSIYSLDIFPDFENYNKNNIIHIYKLFMDKYSQNYTYSNIICNIPNRISNVPNVWNFIKNKTYAF